jgi:TonB family protein
MSISSDVSRKWEGRIIDGKFLLQNWLGDSDHSTVFLTSRGEESPQKAAIKLLSAEGFAPGSFDEEKQLARWRESAKLSHPNLIRLFECGRTTIDDNPFLYVVMEHAEEDLGQILPTRALTSEETAGMLPPTVEALDFLHQAGFVHARIKPSNIMAVQDQIKLSIDGLAKPGERKLVKTAYDAPELAIGGVSEMTDTWSLGTMLVAVLSQGVPAAQDRPDGVSEATIPPNIPHRFREIIQRCLSVDPKQRPTASQILAQLNGSPATVAVSVAAPVADQIATAAADAPTSSLSTAATPVVPLTTARPANDRPRTARQEIAPSAKARPTVTRPAIIVLLVIAALVTGLLLARKSRSQSPPPPSPMAESPSPPVVSSEATSAAPAPIPETKPGSPEPKPGRVLHEALPDVSLGAQSTITGHVKVIVQVSVNPDGTVKAAKITSTGPSRYFSGKALEAAYHWQFEAPRINGQPSSSEWLLRFEFSRNSKQAFPSEIKPEIKS